MQATSKQLPKSAARQGSGQQPRAPKPRRFDPVAMLSNPEMQAALGSGLLMLIAWQPAAGQRYCP